MEELITKINKFRDDRHWRQFHNPKDLSISISLEAAELLENFQWNTNEEALNKNLQGIQEEIADVFIYLIMLCDDLNLDIKAIIENKLLINEKKYPLNKSKGNKNKYNKI